MNSKPETDADVEALRTAGLDVQEVEMPNIFAMHRQINEQAKAIEVEIKGFYVDWVFANLNLTKYR